MENFLLIWSNGTKSETSAGGFAVEVFAAASLEDAMVLAKTKIYGDPDEWDVCKDAASHHIHTNGSGYNLNDTLGTPPLDAFLVPESACVDLPVEDWREEQARTFRALICQYNEDDERALYERLKAKFGEKDV